MASERDGGRKPAPVPSFSILPHTSEVRLAAEGKTPGAMMLGAADGLRALWGLEKGTPARRERISFAADTAEDLLVVWLEELVYRLSARGEVLCGGRVEEATGRSFIVEAAWRALGDDERPKLEVKAATYHGLKVQKLRGRYAASVILDV